MSRTSTASRRRISPTTRGTKVVPPDRFGTSAGCAASMPSSERAKRLE